MYEINTGAQDIFPTVFLPEYLGGQHIDVTPDMTPYGKALLGLLIKNVGTVGEVDYARFLPHTLDEARDGRLVIARMTDALRDAPEGPRYNRKTFVLINHALTLDARSDSSRSKFLELFGSSYDGINPFSSYRIDLDRGVREVLDIPVELRDFTTRAVKATGAIRRVLFDPGSPVSRRYQTEEEIVQNFPSLRIPVGSLTQAESQVFSWVIGSVIDLPFVLSPKQASAVIDTIGAGTLLRIRKKFKNEDEMADMSEREINVAIIAGKVEKALGGINASTLTMFGRAAWGIRSAQLRTGRPDPKITRPKPGI